MCVCVSFTGWWARLWPSKWVPTLRTSAPQMWPTWLVGSPWLSNVVFILTEEKTTHYHWLAAAPEAPDEHFSKLMTPPRILFFFPTEYSATSTQALCGKLFNSFVFTLAKYLVLAHFERKPAGFSVLLQIFKQPCLPPSWKSIRRVGYVPK